MNALNALFIITLAHANDEITPPPPPSATDCAAQVEILDRRSKALAKVTPVSSTALITEFATVNNQLQTLDVNDATALAEGTKFFQNFGREILAQLGRDNRFLDAYQAELEMPDGPIDQVSSNVIELSQQIQSNLDPMTLSRLKQGLTAGNFSGLRKGFRQLIASRMPSVASSNITVRQSYHDIAETIDQAIKKLEDDQLEIGHIQAHLRQVRAALESLQRAGQMIAPDLKAQVESISDPQRKLVMQTIANRFGSTLTQITKGATLATQLEKVWGLIDSAYYDAIETGEDAILITLPAHRAVTSARIAQARQRRVQLAAAVVQSAQIAAFSALARELGEAETERQTHKTDWLQKTVSSFEEMSRALIDVEKRRAKFESEYGSKMEDARKSMNQARVSLDLATVQ